MTIIHRLLAVLSAFFVMTITPQAQNTDRAIVEAFYTQLINPAGAKDKMVEAERILAPSFQSIGDYSGKAKSREELAKQLAGFAQFMPDLNWKIEEILQSGNRYIVRSKASGTPKGPLFGVDGKGKSFTLMSIDIHEVVDGKFARVFHVEDWAGALRQLSAP